MRIKKKQKQNAARHVFKKSRGEGDGKVPPDSPSVNRCLRDFPIFALAEIKQTPQYYDELASFFFPGMIFPQIFPVMRHMPSSRRPVCRRRKARSLKAPFDSSGFPQKCKKNLTNSVKNNKKKNPVRTGECCTFPEDFAV